MKVLSLVVLFLTFVTLAVGQTQYGARPTVRDKDELCGDIIQGLQLCTPKSAITVMSGKAVSLDMALRNVSDTELNVSPLHQWNSGFLLNVTDEKGEKPLTRLEKFNEIRKQRPLTEEGAQVEFGICCNRHGFMGDAILPKGVSVTVRQVLDFAYDFSKPGTYIVDLGRSVANPDGKGDFEVWVRHITVEVK